MLPGQLDMFDGEPRSPGPVRARSAEPGPDRDGLFDAAGVRMICERRQCRPKFKGALAAVVRGPRGKAMATATAPGRWDPVDILRACTLARGFRPAEIDLETAQIENRNRLDELRIARVVAAIGHQPYLTRKGNFTHNKDWFPVETVCGMPGFIAFASARGRPTLVFKRVFLSVQRDAFTPPVRIDKRSETRDILRALEDLALIDVTRRPRHPGGITSINWTERAYLPPSTRLVPDDLAAVEDLAAGLS